jgi:MFS family permease
VTPLPRPVKVLGAVSLLTDASSEMIYPLLPGFVTGTLHAGPAFLGLVEGLAEATAAALKLASGRLSDRLPRRKPLVLAGYGLSSLSRPLMALAALPWHVLAIRMADRFGKGVRGAPRDALVAEVTPAAERGRAYGFHRALDNTGALIGPLLASLVLLYRDDVRLVFALAALPALLSVLLLGFALQEPARVAPAASAPARSAPLPPGFRSYLAVLAIFTLGNSSDAFLLLRAQDAGVPLLAVPLLWALHNGVKAVLSTAGGRLSDRTSRRSTIVAGWALYAAAYAGFAVMSGPLQAAGLFALYGLFHALTEGPERALVADLVGPGGRGNAFGLYHAVTGAAVLPGNLLTGALWQAYGPLVALGTGAALAALAALGLLFLVPQPDRKD